MLAPGQMETESQACSVAGHHLRLLNDGEQAFPAMLAAIDSAQRHVLLEMYWFGSDAVGRRFADALHAAAARGVEVALLYDAVGSWESDSEMFDELRRAGVGVVEYHPVRPWSHRFRLDRLSIRDHRKILVVDGRLGFTGGLNLADQWDSRAQGGGEWRDDVLQIEGPAVAGLLDCFASTWLSASGGPLEALHEARPFSSRELPVRVLGEAYFRRRREIARAYLDSMYRAEKRIWLSNSYFLPDGLIMRALCRAAERGVDVRLITPGVSDVELVRYASRALFGRLLKRGVRIFEWTSSILHSKTAVIDGTWSTVGTFNFDYRSLRSNLEVNVAIEDSGFGALMERSFERDLERCREVDPHDFQFRSLGDRLLSLILYRFRKLL